MVGIRTIDKDSWEAVGKRFTRLSKDARRHFERAGEHAAAERAELDHALQRVVRELEAGLESVRHTISDPALRKDVAKLAEAVRSALLSALPLGGTVAAPEHHETTGRRPVTKHTVKAAEASGKPGAKPTRKPTTKATRKPTTKSSAPGRTRRTLGS